MKKIEVVAAIIIDEEKNILISKRMDGEFKDLWEFPGGKIEQNESHEQALKREIKEELNLEIEIIEFLIKVEYDYPKFHLTMDTYISKIIKGDIKLNVHSDYRWIKSSELDLYKWVPADVQVVQELKKKMI